MRWAQVSLRVSAARPSRITAVHATTSGRCPPVRRAWKMRSAVAGEVFSRRGAAERGFRRRPWGHVTDEEIG